MYKVYRTFIFGPGLDLGNSGLDPNTDPNPYPTLNQKPNDNPRSYSLPARDIMAGSNVTRANVGSPIFIFQSYNN